MPKPPKTNVQIVKSIMENSQYGALAQAFVIDALMKWSDKIANTDPKLLEHGLVNADSWVGVAKEIQSKLNAAYK